MKRAMLSCAALCACSAITLAAPDVGYGYGTMFGDVGPRSVNWYENVGANVLYHNDGGGTRKFAFNTSTPRPNDYFTLYADAAGWFGMSIGTYQTGAKPYFEYFTGGSKSAVHWYDSANSSWNLAIDNGSVLRVDSNHDLNVLDGSVRADAFELNAPRYDWVWYSALSGGNVIQIPNGSIITSIYLVGVDNGAGSITANLYYQDFADLSGSLHLMGSVSSSGSDPSSRSFATGMIASPNVANSNRAYIIDAYGTGAGTQSPIGVRVEYQRNQL